MEHTLHCNICFQTRRNSPIASTSPGPPSPSSGPKRSEPPTSSDSRAPLSPRVGDGEVRAPGSPRRSLQRDPTRSPRVAVGRPQTSRKRTTPTLRGSARGHSGPGLGGATHGSSADRSGGPFQLLGNGEYESCWVFMVQQVVTFLQGDLFGGLPSEKLRTCSLHLQLAAHAFLFKSHQTDKKYKD